MNFENLVVSFGLFPKKFETNFDTRLFQFLRYLCTLWSSNLLIYVLLFYVDMDSIVIPDDTYEKTLGVGCRSL